MDREGVVRKKSQICVFFAAEIASNLLRSANLLLAHTMDVPATAKEGRAANGITRQQKVGVHWPSQQAMTCIVHISVITP
jgi:hypothetical protein